LNDKHKAIQILNNALREIYQLKELSSSEIAIILETYANNEKCQLRQDLGLNQ
jgi:hypothetical protein